MGDGGSCFRSYINRFISADTIVPDFTDPQSLNRYAYVRNNPLKYVDETGHCWGFASGLRNTFYATTCNNLDMAVSIVQHPDASVGQKVGAGAYVAVEAAAHTVAVAGTAVAGVGCLTGAGTMVCAGAGSAATAVSADGDPTNEAVAVVNGVSNAVQVVSTDGNPINEIETVSTGTNVVYQSVVNGVTRYVGITNDFFRRAAEHDRIAGRTIERIQGLSQLNRYDARAVEQVLIEHYGMIKNGGILENQMNSIAPSNPIYSNAIQRGLEILQKTGNLPQ